MADLESLILTAELGRIGGIGARLVARFLPNVSYEGSFPVNASAGVVAKRIREFLEKFGKPIPEFPSDPERGKYSVIVGSGHVGMNPTIVHVQVTCTSGTASVFARAIAKEGMIKQHSAQRLVERIEAILEGV